ncbi:MAG: HipA domain-containing protein [Maritimibacter sp.]|nr:HipA domain-containing protein [Maritimibacter sp.]
MKLDVWMDNVEDPVGVLDRADDKTMRFTYAVGVPAEGRISMSLPLGEQVFSDAACVAYFGNLLFEGQELDRVMALHRIDRDDIAGLLYHLGADCPGAISITPEGTGPGKRPGVFPDDYEELDQQRLEEIVRTLHVTGHLPEDERDPSPVAGVQPKLALVHRDGRFYLPKAGSRAPTTHILKVSPLEEPSITGREAALLSLARRIGLDVIDSHHLTFPGPRGDIGAILSSRFDRVVDGDVIRRLHAEDFCQAAGLSRHLKYERDAAPGGPRFSAQTVRDIAQQTAVPARFQAEFLRHTLFNLAVGNTDNHAKNGSVLYTGPSGVLAPLYDVVPVMMHTRVTHEFSFSIGGAVFAEDLTITALEAGMTDLGFRAARFSKPWVDVLRKVAENIDVVASEGDKALADAVAAQLEVIETAIGVDLGMPERDYYPRQVRDEKPETTGWNGLS